MSDKRTIFHMGEAAKIFEQQKDKLLSREIKRPELGPMGSEVIEIWSSIYGGKLIMTSGMGGSTLVVK